MIRVKGFTLIEILVVLLIIGITCGFALIAFGDFGEKRRIIVAAEQFINNVKLVQQQAILDSSTLGIRFNHNSYQIVRFQVPASWTSMPANSIFHRHPFPKGLVIHWRGITTQRGAPAIIIYSSGDMTPFTLDIGTTKHTSIGTVSGSSNGAMLLQSTPSP